MADTNHSHAAGSDPVEGDGISYRGIIWFVAVLAITTLVSQGLMVLMFKFMAREAIATDTPRAPLSAPAGQLPPKPNLLYLDSAAPQLSEPGNLDEFRNTEDKALTTYEWIDESAGIVRIPIGRAKGLLLQRGDLKSRDTTAPAAPAKGGTAAKTGRNDKTGKTDHHDG
jgi:hypothetical protein